MTERPSGHPPPLAAQLHDGEELDLRQLAKEICSRYRAEFPDEQERYGDAGIAWCLHDNQHILNWAVIACKGFEALEPRIDWLAGVLEARDFPLDRLARDLEIAASVVEDELPPSHQALAEELMAGAGFVRSRQGS